MKKFIVFIFLVFSITVFPQEHIKFMGIPITGNINNFSSILSRSKGLIILEKNKKSIALKGKFTGKKCNFLVMGTTKSKTTFSVLVGFLNDEKNTSPQYEDLISQFTDKYGKCDSIEGKNTLWKLPQGTIYIISRDNSNGIFPPEILILYTDKINEEIENKEKKTAIKEDI